MRTRGYRRPVLFGLGLAVVLVLVVSVALVRITSATPTNSVEIVDDNVRLDNTFGSGTFNWSDPGPCTYRFTPDVAQSAGTGRLFYGEDSAGWVGEFVAQRCLDPQRSRRVSDLP